jgi:DNA-binding protein HU-beta
VALTKSEMMSVLVEKTQLKKKDVVSVLDAYNELIAKVLKKEKKFKIPGIAILQIKHRKARMGRNPMTNEPIKIKAKTVLKARPVKELKDKVL